MQSARQQSRLIFKNATDSTERKSVKSVESVAFLLLDIGRKLHGFWDAVPAEFQIRETADISSLAEYANSVQVFVCSRESFIDTRRPQSGFAQVAVLQLDRCVRFLLQRAEACFQSSRERKSGQEKTPAGWFTFHFVLSKLVDETSCVRGYYIAKVPERIAAAQI